MKDLSAEKPVICSLGPEDREACSRLALRAYAEYFPVLGAEGGARLEAALADPEKWQALLAEATGIGCVRGGELAGMVFVLSSGKPRDVFQADWASLRMLAVDPGCRNRGLATALLGGAVSQARETGETVLALHTGAFMQTAIRRYEKYGFCLYATLPERFGQPYFLYTLDLDAPGPAKATGS